MPVHSYKTKKGTKYRYIFGYQGKSYEKWGFSSSKEAKDAEAKYRDKIKHHGSSNIFFQSLVEEYLEDMKPNEKGKGRITIGTYDTKINIINKHILPAIPNKAITDIKPVDIRKWQNRVVNSEYSETYKKTIQNQLSAIFNYAVKYYELPKNPVPIAGSIGKKHRDSFEFWTVDELRTFLSVVDDKKTYTVIYTLFFTGLRISELLGLQWKDFDNEAKTLNVYKTKQLLRGEWRIGDTKTPKSKRIITLPNHLVKLLSEWRESQYNSNENDFIFITDKTVMAKHITKYAAMAGIKKIRVHDLRHSHASMLVNLGVNIIEISERLGHEKVQTTIDTYIHLYPNQQVKLASKLDEVNINS